MTFKRMDLRKAKMRVEQETPATPPDEKTQLRNNALATPATPATQKASTITQSRESRKSRNEEPPNSHFLEKREAEDLFSYLYDSITTGGPYSRLWPNIRRYIRTQLPKDEVDRLEEAYRLANPDGTQHKRGEPE